MTNLYFAYGSNLNIHDWHAWCRRKGYREGLLRPLFPAILPDRALAFTIHSSGRKGGVLDVVPATGHLTDGMVFEVLEDGWEALDEKEGAPFFYRGLETEALTWDGRAHPVRTYEVTPCNRQTFVRPGAAYLEVIREGCRAFGIPHEHLDLAAEHGEPRSALPNLFAYGTLMRGECRHTLVEREIKAAVLAEVPGLLHDLGAYPGFSPDEAGGECVQGEFFRFADPSILERLDQVEGFPGFSEPGGLYRRRLVQAGMGDGRVRQAWTYVHESATETPIPGGDWRGRRERVLPSLVDAHVAGQEASVLRALKDRWTLGVPGTLTEADLGPWTTRALRDGALSERQLAQASGRWRARVTAGRPGA